MRNDDYTTPLSEVKRVVDGQFNDSDGSLFVLPLNVCVDLDDDCSLDKMGTKEHRKNCFLYQPDRGICPFVSD